MRAPEMLAKKGITLRTGVTVEAIDRAAQQVRLANPIPAAREDIARHRSGLRRTGEATPSRRAESVKPVRNTTAVVPTARSAREETFC